jgi:microcystin-dependent protein
MEGTIGEIRAFAGNFAPMNWQFCQGQALSIAQETALFSILGTTYGGDGVTTFLLPNTQSRIVIGTGQGAGLPVYELGEVLGEEGHTLSVNEMPAHNHTATVQTGSTPASAVFELMGINGQGGKPLPQNNLLGQDATATIYAPGGSPPVAMNAGSVVLNSLTTALPTVTVGLDGSSVPHSNIQPVLGMNYIICINGIFPSRN